MSADGAFSAQNAPSPHTAPGPRAPEGRDGPPTCGPAAGRAPSAAVITAVVGVVLIAVGLPLLAWWMGGRAFWSRLRGRPERDPWGDMVRTHRLTAAEAARVAKEVPRGVRFDDPRLRAAAVDWAHELLGWGREPWPRSERVRSWLVFLFVCWLTAIVSWAVFRVVTGHAGDVNWFTVACWAASGIWGLRRRQLLHRALAENGGADLSA
jgi:hypothetical protein